MKRAVLALLLLAAPATAQPSLQQQVEARLALAGPGVRFGLVVADAAGRELLAIAPEGRFMPASNTKIFTTAAAFATLPALDQPDSVGGASVWLAGSAAEPDVVLEGHGDARLSSASDCVTDCLSALADAVAGKTRRVHDVIGDDSALADERWSPGMSWNNIPSGSGTAVSALTADDNVLTLRILPGPAGSAPKLEGLAYYQVENRALTVADGATSLDFSRLPGSRTLVLTGTIRADASPQTLVLAIDEPAYYAAWRLRALLQARGVTVTGATIARHAPPGSGVFSSGIVKTVAALARLTPPPLSENLKRINKESQNLHAELILRRIGAQAGDGSIAGGLKAVAAMLAGAGVPRTAWDLSDGSGMSSYNRVAPRGVVALLRWIAAQPWGAAWRATLPVGGVDGTLARRFKGTVLEGRIFAKTGTLNGTNALAGWVTTASGRSLAFAFYANDVPEGVKATEAMDSALLMVAQAD